VQYTTADLNANTPIHEFNFTILSITMLKSPIKHKSTKKLFKNSIQLENSIRQQPSTIKSSRKNTYLHKKAAAMPIESNPSKAPLQVFEIMMSFEIKSILFSQLIFPPRKSLENSLKTFLKSNCYDKTCATPCVQHPFKHVIT